MYAHIAGKTVANIGIPGDLGLGSVFHAISSCDCGACSRLHLDVTESLLPLLQAV
jgi:hypothetical protein